MSNVIDFPVEDISYITGKDGEPPIVGVRCKNISLQLSCDLHSVLLGDVEIKREELIAFILGVGIHYDFADQLSKSVDSDRIKHKDDQIAYLWKLLDDISTAGDMYRPEINEYFKYVNSKCEDRSDVANSVDGMTLIINEID